MKIYFLLLLFIGPVIMSAQAKEASATVIIKGIVVDEDNKPIPNASISKLDSFVEGETNEDGTFSINAKPGDILKFVSLWMDTKELKVEDLSQLRVVMNPNAELLEEVLVINKRQEELINTPFGKKRRASVGYQAKSMEEFISPADIDMTSVVKKFPDIKWSGNNITFSFFLRRGGITEIPVLVLVDGVPVDQNYLIFLNPVDVETITLIKSLVGTIKYGTLGAGGVMLIETKMFARLSKEDKTTSPQLLVQGNDYDEQLRGIQTYMSDTTPDYLTELGKANSFEEAKKVYNIVSRKLDNYTVDFFMNCANYFQKWDSPFSYRVLSEVFKRAENNPKILKTIAYKLEESGHLNQAKFVYEKILELRPEHAQSYRDLALIYIQTAEFEVAKTLYIQMLNNSIPNVDFTVIRPAIANEFQHFLLINRTKVKYDDIPNDFLVATNRPEIRLVLEWTDPMSEFEVQFVGPQKKYFVWSHSAYGDNEFIQSEIKDGISMKEFEIDKAPSGEWLVNIKNIKTNNTAGRTYLRYTLFKNYGLASEEKKTVLIPLEKLGEKIILDTFLN